MSWILFVEQLLDCEGNHVCLRQVHGLDQGLELFAGRRRKIYEHDCFSLKKSGRLLAGSRTAFLQADRRQHGKARLKRMAWYGRCAEQPTIIEQALETSKNNSGFERTPNRRGGRRRLLGGADGPFVWAVNPAVSFSGVSTAGCD